MAKKILVWFRNDLRLHDNGVLVEAIAKSDEILPVYIFDPRQFEATKYHSLKTGAIRTKFMIESVAALRQSFQNLGGNLLVLQGSPETLLPNLVNTHQIAEVYHHREVATEETKISSEVEDLLWKQKVNLKHIIGHTLYNKEDLPFPIKDIPDVFAQFKKKTERDAIVKPCFLTPTAISFVQLTDWGLMPSLVDLVKAQNIAPTHQLDTFKGGEQEALAHLHEFLHTGEDMATQPGEVKRKDIISKLSAWLAVGSLSPREVYWKMKEAEANHGLKPYFNQAIQGLLWRDYYRFMFKKHSNIFFTTSGFNQKVFPDVLANNTSLNNWKNGTTGQPLVDLLMKELNDTGYINVFARQLLAIYFVQKLQLNWVYGAAHFEEKLIDYAPASNWGNWANLAGVGNDDKLTNSYSFDKQLKICDPKGIFSTPLGA